MMLAATLVGKCQSRLGAVMVSIVVALLLASGSTNFAMAQIYEKPDTRNQTEARPMRYGMILFQAFQALDVFGPLDILQVLSRQYKMDLALISTTNMDPVTTAPRTPSMNPKNSSFFQSIVPTHTLQDAPDLDVLIIPGGIGTRAPDLNSTVDYIAATYPKLQYIMSICTGARLAARAGVLDGKKATTNKAAYDRVVPLAPKAKWIRNARWTEDGDVWTSSGVSAGMDATLAFVANMYGEDVADDIANSLEYSRIKDPSNDPFADLRNVTGSESVPSSS